MWWCSVVIHIAQWHDGSKRSGKTGTPFRTTSAQEDPTWRTTQFKSLFPCSVRVSSGSRSMSQNYVSHSARHSGLPRTCSALDTPCNFRGATITSLCSSTGLVGTLPTGLSWTNRRYGRNLGSLTRTKLDMPIKWMEASLFSSSKESSPYTMCCEGDVHWWVILHHAVPPKADVKRSATFVQLSGENDDIWWYRTPTFSMTMQGVTPLLPRTSCAAGNGRFWNIHRTHPIWVHAITNLRPSERTTARNPVQHKRWAYPCSIRNINKVESADGVRRLPNIWQKVINNGAAILKVHNIAPLWIKTCRKYRTVAITFYPALVYKSCNRKCCILNGDSVDFNGWDLQNR